MDKFRYNPFKVERLIFTIEEEIEDTEAWLKEEGVKPPRLSIGLKRAVQELKEHLLGDWEG
jgi:hypothetical protein